jgi:hypothetical protein
MNKEELGKINTKVNFVTIDGDNANTNIADALQGFGCVTGNNYLRLLLDYKSENETDNVDSEWIIYLKNHLPDYKLFRY